MKFTSQPTESIILLRLRNSVCRMTYFTPLKGTCLGDAGPIGRVRHDWPQDLTIYMELLVNRCNGCGLTCQTGSRQFVWTENCSNHCTWRIVPLKGQSWAPNITSCIPSRLGSSTGNISCNITFTLTTLSYILPSNLLIKQHAMKLLKELKTV